MKKYNRQVKLDTLEIPVFFVQGQLFHLKQ